MLHQLIKEGWRIESIKEPEPFNHVVDTKEFVLKRYM